MLVPLELSRIIICEFNQHQVIFLKEKNGVREFPVVIGLFEATMIDRKLRGTPSERPLTHDLFGRMVQALGGTLLDVVIYKVDGQTFYAHLRVNMPDRIVLLDARPSDAIAVSLCVEPHLPLFATQEVFDEVAPA